MQSQHIAAKPSGATLPGATSKPPISGTHKELQVTFLSFPILLFFPPGLSCPMPPHHVTFTNYQESRRSPGEQGRCKDALEEQDCLLSCIMDSGSPKSHLLNLNSKQRNYICNPKTLDLNNPLRLSQFLLWHQKVEPIPLFFLLGLDTAGEYTSESAVTETVP